jgi:hypothetical protein
MANTALNRTVAALWTNKSGGALTYGDVVVLDNTNAKGFTTTTTAGLATRGLGVIIEPNGIANNATGLVATAGWCPKVNLNTAATVGQFLKTHTVAGQATPHDSPQITGDFGYALQASATPEAVLFGSANGPVSSLAGPGSSTDNAIVRWDGAGGATLQDSAITVSDTGAITFPDNIRQTFNPGADAAGINVGSIAGDPGTPSNGDLWYDSSANELTARINGANVALGAGGGSGTAFELLFSTLGNEPPASNPATPDLRNSHPVLDFDGSTDEEAVFSGVLSNDYGGGGLTIDTFWAFTSATSGSLRVQTAIERIDASSLDIDADSFASFNSAGGTAPGTSGHVIKVTVTHASGAEMDSLAAGELFRLKIRRDADGTSGTDDIATDAELVYATVRET